MRRRLRAYNGNAERGCRDYDNDWKEKTGRRNDSTDKSTTRRRDRHHNYDCNEGEKGTSRVTVGKSFSQILQLIHHVGISQ